MAYKYLNDEGLKAYTKKVKGALKDLHTPIAISSENTTESKAQNVRNIADFVTKAKAAGIADVNGMAVTCIIDDDYSGVGYFYYSTSICGIKTFEDISNPYTFAVINGEYSETLIVIDGAADQITSNMLTQGARRPIILTPETTEVDEETYQKLISDDVDVVFKTGDNYCALTYKYDNVNTWNFCFTRFSHESNSINDTYLYGYEVRVTKTGTLHQCEVIDIALNQNSNSDFINISKDGMYFVDDQGYTILSITQEGIKTINVPSFESTTDTEYDINI